MDETKIFKIYLFNLFIQLIHGLVQLQLKNKVTSIIFVLNRKLLHRY